MSSSDSDRPVVRRNDKLRDTVMIILRQNIPGIDGMIITQALLARVKDVLLNNMEQITAALSGVLIAIGGSVLLPTIFIAVINAIGFTSAGVAAGSLAALIQGSVYGAWTGGVFSGLQSIGATAVIAPPVAIGLAATAVVVGGGVFAYQRYKRRRRIALPSLAADDDDDDDTPETSERTHSGDNDSPPLISWKPDVRPDTGS